MKISQLQYFKVVSDSKNISDAANISRVPATTIVSSIHSLENELGVELFYRTGRKLILTDIGQTILKYTNNILNYESSMEEDLKRVSSNIDCRVCSSVPSILTKITSYSTYTGLNIYTVLRDTIDAVFYLQNDLYDIVIAEEPIYDSGIISEQVITDYVWFSIPKSNPLSNKSMINLEDLKNETIITTYSWHKHSLFFKMYSKIEEQGIPIIEIQQGTTDACERLSRKSNFLYFLSSIDRHSVDLGKDRRFVLLNPSTGISINYYISYLQNTKIPDHVLYHFKLWLKHACFYRPYIEEQ